MTTYARKENGLIVEVFPTAFYDVDVFTHGTSAQEPTAENPEGVAAVAPVLVHKAGDEIPIAERFHPDFVAALEVVPEGSVPEPLPQPAMTSGQAQAIKDNLLALATVRIAPLQDAVDLEEATAAEVALLKKWKQYRIAVNRIDVSVLPITWPVQPE